MPSADPRWSTARASLLPTLSPDPLSSQSGDQSCSCSAVPCFLADALRLVAPLAGLLHRQLREGDRHSEQGSARATSSSRAALRWLCSSTASERWFESGRFNGIDYYDDGQHDGRRERALSALRAGGSGAGGIDGAFFVGVVCVAAASAAAC